MEAGSMRKDVIKRFWNIGFEHSAIALHLVRTLELRDDAQLVGKWQMVAKSQRRMSAAPAHRGCAVPNLNVPSLKLTGEQTLVAQGRNRARSEGSR
jgi:hypothetical protein